MKSHSLSEPRLVRVKPVRLAGLSAYMSYLEDQTGLLWQRFMPRRRELTGRLNDDLISLQIFPAGFFRNPDPSIRFTKWACAEIGDGAVLPAGFEELLLPEGDYAVLYYRGPGGDETLFRQIFGNLLPSIGMEPDDRPHFERLGAGFRHGDPQSEEELWIPVRPIK
ncbi:MAG: GyrI-like domain-containing protein [Bacteroidetes bacterium]|nr:GyrI-like domain-containing protein [Bacteroidota bacterium]